MRKIVLLAYHSLCGNTSSFRPNLYGHGLDQLVHSQLNGYLLSKTPDMYKNMSHQHQALKSR